MKLLLDMNLAPALVAPLASAGHDPTHWSATGDPRATDREILDSARLHGQVVVTHDLDFGALLASSGADGPSVLQVRMQDIAPDRVAPLLIAALASFEDHLEAGALVTLDERRARARILPLRRQRIP